MGRVLGVDLGTRRIGLALSDPDRHDRVAARASSSARATAGADRRTIVAAAREHEADRDRGIGLPTVMSGKVRPGRAEPPRGDRRAADAAPVTSPSSCYDERFTTVIAQRALVESGMSRRKRKGRRQGGGRGHAPVVPRGPGVTIGTDDSTPPSARPGRTATGRRHAAEAAPAPDRITAGGRPARPGRHRRGRVVLVPDRPAGQSRTPGDRRGPAGLGDQPDRGRARATATSSARPWRSGCT